jgi:large subunit ribosomal protein L23
VQSIFDVKVVSVNTLNRQGKRVRSRRAIKGGKRRDTKRALVTLAEGHSIELFNV